MKMYKLAAVAAFALSLSSCKHEGGTTAPSDYKTSRNGLQYKMIKDESSPNAQVGNFVKFTTALYTLAGDSVFRMPETERFVYGEVAQPRHQGDPLEILQMVGPGDSVSVIIP